MTDEVNVSLVNAVACYRCDEIIESTHRHDFVTCRCGGISVDGGTDYHKRSFDPAGPGWYEFRTHEELDAARRALPPKE